MGIRIILTTLKPADIVLVHTPEFSPLRFFTGMQFNHVFILDERIFGDWKIAESISKGTTEDLLSNYKGQTLAGYRYRNLTDEQVERIRFQLAVMGKFYYDYLIPFRVLRSMGLRRTITTLFKLWSHDYPLNIPHVKDNWVVCSEYAQEAYSRAEVPIQDDQYLLLPDSPLYEPANESLYLAWRTDHYSGDPNNP